MAKQTSKKFNFKKAVLTLGAVAIVAGSATVAKRVIDPSDQVIEVFDGDTFRISNKQKIRLYSIDAPELEYCYGKEAKEALEKKIMGKKVILKNLKVDFFYRVQAYVYLDGELINEYMVKNGFAFDHGAGDAESELIKKANSFAKENKIGIYSEKCFPSEASKKGCYIKAQVSYDKKGRFIYYPVV